MGRALTWTAPPVSDLLGYFVIRESVITPGTWQVLKQDSGLEYGNAWTYDFVTDPSGCMLPAAAGTYFNDPTGGWARRYQIIPISPTLGMPPFASETGGMFDARFAGIDGAALDNKIIAPPPGGDYFLRSYVYYGHWTKTLSMNVTDPTVDIEPVEITNEATKWLWRMRSSREGSGSSSNSYKAVFTHPAGEPGGGLYPTKISLFDDNRGETNLNNGYIANTGKSRWRTFVFGSWAFNYQDDYYRDPWFASDGAASIVKNNGWFYWEPDSAKHDGGVPDADYTAGVLKVPEFAYPWNFTMFGQIYTEVTTRITGYGAGIMLMSDTIGGNYPPTYYKMTETYDDSESPMDVDQFDGMSRIYGFTGYNYNGFKEWAPTHPPQQEDYFAGLGPDGSDFLFPDLFAGYWKNNLARYREIRFRSDGENTPFTILLRDNPIPDNTFPPKCWRLGVIVRR